MTASSYSGKVALVTGAGKGVGRIIAETLAARGLRVAANDISPINVEAVADGIRAAGGQVKTYLHDVAKKVAVQSLVNEVSDDFGRIDLLVHCANVEPRTPLLEIDEWDLHRVFEVNAIGAALVTQSVGRVMRAQGGGTIILTAKPATGRADTASAYSQTARIGLVEPVASELSPLNIHVLGLIADHSVYNKIDLVIFDLIGGQYADGTILNLTEGSNAE